MDTPSPQPNTPSQPKILLWIVGGVVILALLGLVLWQYSVKEGTNTPITNVNVTANSNASGIPADWRTYKDTEARFSLRYPDNWKLDKRSSESAIYLNATRGVQEPVHLIQIIRGDEQAALDWMNRNRAGSAARFDITPETMRINRSDVPIASDGTSAFRYALASVSPYVLVIWTFPPLDQETYATIVGSISY